MDLLADVILDELALLQLQLIEVSTIPESIKSLYACQVQEGYECLGVHRGFQTRDGEQGSSVYSCARPDCMSKLDEIAYRVLQQLVISYMLSAAVQPVAPAPNEIHRSG